MRKFPLEFKEDENGCFIITSHRLNGEGYGYMRHNGKFHRIHRFIYQECFGDVPDNLVVRHKCDVRSCINPEHLELGTTQENTLDCIARGRKAIGMRSGANKITDEKAREIKKMLKDGKRNCEIERSLNVSSKTVYKIKINKTWKHIDL